jgi:hypothetical protein
LHIAKFAALLRPANHSQLKEKPVQARPPTRETGREREASYSSKNG